MTNEPDRSAAGDASRLSRDEADQVLALAGQLETSIDLRNDGALTVGELASIAGEAGLDPDNVRKAAARLASSRESRLAIQTPRRFLGAPTSLVSEREVEGVLDQADHEAWAELIRRLTGRHGNLESGRTTVSWWTRRTASSLRVTSTSANGRTRIRAEQNHGEYIFGITTLAIAGPGLMGGGAALTAALVLGAPLIIAAGGTALILGGTYAFARRIVSREVQRDEVTIDVILDKLAEFTAAHAQL